MAALGVVTFDMLLGLLIAALGAGVGRGLSISASQANTGVLVFRGLVGVVLFTLGIMQLRGVNLKPKLVDAFTYRVRSSYQATTRKSPTFYYLYGLGYTAAGMGCTGPLLAGLIVYALGSGGFTSALLAFLIFSGTMAVLMLIISLIVARSSGRVVKRLKGASPGIKRLSAVLLMGVGAFTALSTVFLAEFVLVLFP
jgi:cytochrome c biogenesis protein CcdA